MNRTLYRRALLLSYLTVGYNVAEGAVAVAAGWLAGSVALVGFGLDSFVESLSGAIMVWRFRHREEVSTDEVAAREARALRLVGWTFLLLAGYVAFESVETLVRQEPPSPTRLGVAIAVVSLGVMPGLAIAKSREARGLGSRSLMADARQTIACMWLSGALLLGLGLNGLFGLWWADPVAALVIAGFLVREGKEALEGEQEKSDEGDESGPARQG